MIEAQKATVYLGGGRRWFTKRAACRAEAKAKIKTRCECEKPNFADMHCGITCHYHEDMARFWRIVDRLEGFYFRSATAQTKRHARPTAPPEVARVALAK